MAEWLTLLIVAYLGWLCVGVPVAFAFCLVLATVMLASMHTRKEEATPVRWWERIKSRFQ